MKRVLLIVHTNSYFSGLIQVGRLLKASEEYEPCFFFSRTYPTLDRDLEVCRAEKILFVDPYEIPGVHASGEQMTVSSWASRREPRVYAVARLFRSIAHSTGRWRRQFSGFAKARATAIYQLWHLRKRLRFAADIIQQQDASLILLAGDIAGYDTALFIKAAHQVDIPAIVIPSWMATSSENAEYLKNNLAYSLLRLPNRLVGMIYPQWVYEHKGQKLLRLPSGEVLARQWLGLAPPLPWVLHSGHADVIAVESEAMRRYCMAEGLPPEQLVVVGSLAHDIMSDILQNATDSRTILYQDLALPIEYPMLLSALPPDFLHGGSGRSECDFQEYYELVRFWVQALTSIEKYNVVISLHPSVKYEDMKFIEQWGAKIATGATAALIPLCDIYVASVSATIQWAIACGKPVVNYDVYRYHYPDYVDAKGVIHVQEKEEFLDMMKYVAQDLTFQAEIRALQADCASDWGRLDGQAGHRLLQLFAEQIARREKCRH